MSKKDCLQADWQREGYSAGMDGEVDSAGAYSKRADICAKYGQTADWQAFELGHAEGIERFCDISNAVALGARGARKVIEQQICPDDEYYGFETAFYAGYRLHELRSQASHAQQEYERLQNQQYRYQRDIQFLRQQIQSNEATDEQKQIAARRMRSIRRDINSLQSSIYYYRNLANRHQRAAETYARMLETEYGTDQY